MPTFRDIAAMAFANWVSLFPKSFSNSTRSLLISFLKFSNLFESASSFSWLCLLSTVTFEIVFSMSMLPPLPLSALVVLAFLNSSS